MTQAVISESQVFGSHQEATAGAIDMAGAERRGGEPCLMRGEASEGCGDIAQAAGSNVLRIGWSGDGDRKCNVEQVTPELLLVSIIARRGAPR